MNIFSLKNHTYYVYKYEYSIKYIFNIQSYILFRYYNTIKKLNKCSFVENKLYRFINNKMWYVS